LKKVLVTLLGLFGVPRSDSAPHGDSAPGKFFRPEPLSLRPCPMHLFIHKLQSCINTAPLPKALSRACYLRQHHWALWQNCGIVTCHNTRVRHCDRTRTLACHNCEPSSFSRYKTG